MRTLFNFLLLISIILPSQSENYSLYYTYSAITKPLISEDYHEFHNSIELNDIQMHFCNSVNKTKLLTKLCRKYDRLFQNERDELRYKREWLQTNLNTLMRHMRNENRTNDTDLHVLQWRHGCVVKRHSNGSVICLQGTDEYGYDGENLTFDLSMHWKPVVLENGVIWNRESVSSLERKCVETLTNFTGLPQKGRFIMKCFYPKRVQMEITRSWSPLPDEQLNSSGIRPNADGCFQLMKSLEILLSDSSHYNCVVNGDEEFYLSIRGPYWVWQWVTVLATLIVVSIIVYQLKKCVKHPEKQKTPKTPSQVKLSSPETHACLATALNDSSDEENPADDSMVKVQTEELHETQSLCDAKVTPAAAPTAARGEMGSKNGSLPNFAIEKEDTHENSVTQNALQLALIQRCRFKNISMPSLALKRKDTSDSS